MSDSTKQAHERFRFKHRVCYKTCGLWIEKPGGFCKSERKNIDHCLKLEKTKENEERYRNLPTVIEWLEIFHSDYGLVFETNDRIEERVISDLAETRRDCYEIAERITEEIRGIIKL